MPKLSPSSQTDRWAFWRVVWPDAVQDFGLELATGRWQASRVHGLGVLRPVVDEDMVDTQRRIREIARSEGFVFIDGSSAVASALLAAA